LPISAVGVGDIVESKIQQLDKTPSENVVDGVEILKSTWFFICKGESLPQMDGKILAVTCRGWDGPSESTVDLVFVLVLEIMGPTGSVEGRKESWSSYQDYE
jgi:hypothetical protein